MRFRFHWISLLGAGLLALPALAQPPERPAGDRPESDPAMKQKLLDAFDTNQDGTIDRTEAREIGRAMRENFNLGPGSRGRGPQARPGPAGPPPRDGQGPAGRRGRGPDAGPADRGADDRKPRGPRRGEGRGPEGRGPGGYGPPAPPNPERLFNRFDENKDGSLSKEEFMELTKFMREHHPMGPSMMGRGRSGRGFDGQPPRGDFQRRRGDGWRRGGPPGPPPADRPANDESPNDAK